MPHHIDDTNSGVLSWMATRGQDRDVLAHTGARHLTDPKAAKNCEVRFWLDM